MPDREQSTNKAHMLSKEAASVTHHTHSQRTSRNKTIKTNKQTNKQGGDQRGLPPDRLHEDEGMRVQDSPGRTAAPPALRCGRRRGAERCVDGASGPTRCWAEAGDHDRLLLPADRRPVRHGAHRLLQRAVRPVLCRRDALRQPAHAAGKATATTQTLPQTQRQHQKGKKQQQQKKPA